MSYPVLMPDRELQALLRRLSQITRGRGRRYPAAVRQRIQTWVAAQLDGGARWDEVSRELGIPVLRCTPRGSENGRSLHGDWQ